MTFLLTQEGRPINTPGEKKEKGEGADFDVSDLVKKKRKEDRFFLYTKKKKKKKKPKHQNPKTHKK